MPEQKEKTSPGIAVLIAVITGLLAGIPALLGYLQAPGLIEGEVRKIQTQSDAALKLQRDREISKALSELSIAEGGGRSGAALSLAVLGGDEVIPVLVGKLREAAFEIAVLKERDDTQGRDAEIRNERQFVDALRQALLMKGMKGLAALVDLNREMKFNAQRLPRSREVHLRQGWYTQDLEIHNEAREVVKDVMGSLLVATSLTTTSKDAGPSPIAQAGINFAEVDLSYMVLSKINFSGVDLSHADFSSTRLNLTRFKDADLAHANFEQSGLNSADFSGADLRQANFKAAFNFADCDFEAANVAGAIVDNREFIDHLKAEGALNCCGPDAGNSQDP